MSSDMISVRVAARTDALSILTASLLTCHSTC